MSFSEYRLKSTLAGLNHNVMMLPQPIQNLTPPIKMQREEKAVFIDDQKKRAKKSQVIQLEDEDEVRLMEKEKNPWIIEDLEDKVFKGRLEGGQEANYVLFVNQGTDFKVIPAKNWYKFIPKLNYSTLSLDEAESKMSKRRNAQNDRWMMHSREKPEMPKKKIHAIEEEKEEIDFDEIFDDDEGFGEDAEQVKVERPKKLGSQGRQLKQIVRNLDRGTTYESDEDEDQESDFEQAEKKPVKETEKRQAEEDQAVKRMKLISTHSPVPPSSPSTPQRQITEEEFLSHLNQGPITTKDLIAKLKKQNRMDAAGKALFKQYFKKYVLIKGGADENKVLELKPEYK